MDWKRLWRTIRLSTTNNRSEYIRNAHIFAGFGANSTISSRIIPIYPELISIGNNVRLAARVHLIPHDMIHAMLNNRQSVERCAFSDGQGGCFKENIGCIRIDDNVFIGADTTILGDTHIGRNVIVGANSLVNKDLESGYVYAGLPAKKICTFEDFVKKREMKVTYPDSFKRTRDSIDKNFADWLWDDFWKRRENE